MLYGHEDRLYHPCNTRRGERTELEIPAFEFLIVVDDELAPFNFNVSFTNEGVNHPRDGFPRCPRHVREVLLEGELIDLDAALANPADVVGQLQHDVCDAAGGILQGQALD